MRLSFLCLFLSILMVFLQEVAESSNEPSELVVNIRPSESTPRCRNAWHCEAWCKDQQRRGVRIVHKFYCSFFNHCGCHIFVAAGSSAAGQNKSSEGTSDGKTLFIFDWSPHYFSKQFKNVFFLVEKFRNFWKSFEVSDKISRAGLKNSFSISDAFCLSVSSIEDYLTGKFTHCRLVSDVCFTFSFFGTSWLEHCAFSSTTGTVGNSAISNFLNTARHQTIIFRLCLTVSLLFGYFQSFKATVLQHGWIRLESSVHNRRISTFLIHLQPYWPILQKIRII